MNPPLATEADRKALVEGLRAGVIDCVATDHAPHARAEKELPFTEAPMGTTGLETAFAALYTELVLPGVLDLGLLVERMTAGAALFELPTAAHRRRGAGKPDAARPRRRVDRRRARLAESFGELLLRRDGACAAGYC